MEYKNLFNRDQYISRKDLGSNINDEVLNEVSLYHNGKLVGTKKGENVFKFDILRENGIMICESKPEKTLPEALSPYKVHREYGYGKIKVTVYTREAGCIGEGFDR